MAKDLQQTSSVQPNSFDKQLVEDINDFHLPKDVWSQARNAINNSKTGDLGKLGNEPANQYCASAKYTIIGGIHLQADNWLIMSTDNTDSEIGYFSQDNCSYTTLVNDPCLNFSTNNLIVGVSKPTGDCTVDVYWDDQGRNPSRFMRINTNSPYDLYVPWVCIDTEITPGSGCYECVPVTPRRLDCEKIRLAPLVTAPCLRVEKGVTGGTLLNGSYFVVAAYSVNGVRITDYYSPSNVQALFDHDNVAGSLDIYADFTDDRFDEYELVLVSTINQQTVARKVGNYSVKQAKITLDIINNNWPTVPINQIGLLNQIVDKTDSMYSVANYLIRVGPTNKYDFNYQPIANQIVVKWQSVEYPGDYYRKGGNNTGYLRDEVYSLFIRWVYNTGDKSASYHIPGRPKYTTDVTPSAAWLPTDPINERWFCENTATYSGSPGTVLPDGGVVIGEGYMGYWESTEMYPDNKPLIWDSNVTTTPYSSGGTLLQPALLSLNLCGDPIRHHKMPDNALHPNVNHFATGAAGDKIRILGLAFSNIKPPVDENGNAITNIVGYEILRGSRQGNRSIIAKGIINNMGIYPNTDINPSRTFAYANYPYNDVQPDPFLSTSKTATDPCGFFGGGSGGVDPVTYNKQSLFSDQPNPFIGGYVDHHLYSFHSPDTNFTHPFLATTELKHYGKLYGNPVGKFEYSEKHPKEKLVTDLTFAVSLIAGLGIAYISMAGKTNVSFNSSGPQGGAFNGTAGLAPGVTGILGGLLGTAASVAGDAMATTMMMTGGDILAMLAGIPALGVTTASNLPSDFWLDTSNLAGAISGALLGGSKDGTQHTSRDAGGFTVIPSSMRTPASSVPAFFYYLSEGTDSVMELIKAIIKYREFGLKYNSHCLYNRFTPIDGGLPEMRRAINESAYIGPDNQDFGANYRISNQFRSNFVAVELASRNNPIANNDNSRFQTQIGVSSSIARTSGNTLDNPIRNHFITESVCTYSGLKYRIRNQYGQLNSIMQMPVTECVQYIPKTGATAGQPIFQGNSPVMFNGDIYIGRYTEKNTFFYFYDWLFDQPDGYQFDYIKHRMLLWPAFWANFEGFETQDFISPFTDSSASFTDPGSWVLPNSMYVLDGAACETLQFSIKNAWFYLFSSGVRDFFVESEINIDLRDWGNLDSERHYDPYYYTNEKALFNTEIIKAGNYYKYDQSLSVSKTYMNYISWGFLQALTYDPQLAANCYRYQPKRVIYSLPGNFESKKDGWRIFLPLNYKDFIAQVTCIKPINKSGALVLFDSASPVEFQGTDQLQTSLGTKLTIGDGGLFTQPMQSIVNSDDPYEYASCQNRLSVVNTPTGVFWMSQNQGKIYQLSSSALKEVSTDNLKWWFAQYLPYLLTQDFPDFDLVDNPVSGIGCQTIYDNENSIIYFCKKDYTLRKDIFDTVRYDLATQQFIVNGIVPVQLGDPAYFEDASWTISYDPKTGGFISYHDWHPDLLFPSKTTFMSVSKVGQYKNNPLDPAEIPTPAPNSIWVHNFRCDLYCNYYGFDKPFEVEWTMNTVQDINTLRSIEYIMEMYKYAPNCYDRYHVLNENFDEATIYNTEQCSGLLKLDLTPRNDLPLLLQYPIINPTNIRILYSKVENKYRFNQFWDITRERGGQDVGIPGVPSFAEQTIWNTPPNGYARVLNPNNLNYNKDELQRKKFRHYTTSVLLRKLVSLDKKILVMIANNKNLHSPR